jgi:mono/diheme cytochrome c family protein
MSPILRRTLLVVGVLFLLLQLVPYGRSHENPPVREEPAWDSPETRALAERACFDCHSNETAWPWYSWVAPVSWLVEHDVEEAREHLNFSEFDRPQKDADEAAEEVEEGEMPLWFYKPLHAEARLSGEELATLIQGLKATFGPESD